MDNKIAVLFQDNGSLAQLEDVDYIRVYTKDKDWEISKTIFTREFSDSTEAFSIKKMRRSTEKLSVLLTDSPILLGRSIIGIFFYVLASKGFMICEADEFSTELLDQMLSDYIKNKENIVDSKMEIPYVPLKPQQLEHKGHYYLNFSLIQKYHPQLSSKKVLLPFLSHEDYETLTVVCPHIMPWLENYINEHDLGMTAARENGEYTIIVENLIHVWEGQ